jgi:4-hydroxythreonine-4-phosphate dehydrogenase
MSMELRKTAPKDAPAAVTMGDPAGIGPDVAILSWLRRVERNCPPFFVIGGAAVLQDRAKALKAAGHCTVEAITEPAGAQAVFSRAIPLLQSVSPATPVTAGSPSAANAPAIIASIERAVALTLAGEASAVVTAPIAKHVLLEQGFAHAGHTEFLAELAVRHGFDDTFPVMLMASPRLFAVPVTVHIALKDVPAALTPDRLVRTAEVTADGLRRYFAISEPRLALCGLNPHAGEEGKLGREEIETIAPAVALLQARGIRASGPLPADTLFHAAARQTYDAVLAMYHDQALIPFKTLSFEDGVNVTLGLPFIRTSPDHGTAFALAGTGRADPTSFIEALKLARRMHEAALASAPSVMP